MPTRMSCTSYFLQFIRKLELNKAADLLKRINNYTCEAKALQKQLDNVQQECTHIWLPVVASTELKTEYLAKQYSRRRYPEGDRWAMESVEVQVPTWSRTCSVCCKTEKTTDMQIVTTSIPKF